MQTLGVAKKIRLYLGILCAGAILESRSFAEPVSLMAESEPGLRLRVYAVETEPSFNAAIKPDQIPNIDETLCTSELKGHWIAFGEVLEKNLIITMDGWFQVAEDGVHRFRLETNPYTDTSFTARIEDEVLAESQGGAPLETRLELKSGWHYINVQVIVREPGGADFKLHFQPPSVANSGVVCANTFLPLPANRILAPKCKTRSTLHGYKHIMPSSDRPGLGQKLAALHPGYSTLSICPDMPVGGLALLDDGRLAVACFDAKTLNSACLSKNPNGQLWVIDNPYARAYGERIIAHQIASGLFEPKGLCSANGSIFISQRDEVTRFDRDSTDKDNWKPTTVANGWATTDFHQFSAGLLHATSDIPGHPGHLILARTSALGQLKNPPGHGALWRIDLSQPRGQNIDWITGGHRTPNGVCFGPQNQVFAVDNQGEWTPSNELNHIQQGKFYGYYQNTSEPDSHASPFQPRNPDDPDAEVTQPAIILPHNEIAASPSQPQLFPAGSRFAGQLALPDMRYGGINRVYLEQINGTWQGCVMRFTQGLRAGPNRICFGNGGSLFVGGIGGGRPFWHWKNSNNEATYQSLERLDPNSAPVFEIESLRAVAGGFELFFTEPAVLEDINNVNAYTVSQWTYRASCDYGGRKVDKHLLTVREARAASDGRSVRLRLSGMKKGYVLHLRCNPRSISNGPIWSGEVWYTLNSIL